jgi:hypothetical protein
MMPYCILCPSCLLACLRYKITTTAKEETFRNISLSRVPFVARLLALQINAI